MVAERTKNLMLGVAVLVVMIVGASAGFFLRVRKLEPKGSELTATAEAAGNLRIGDRFPDIALAGADGKVIAVKDLLDGSHFVAVNFHHPDCPCAANCGKLISAMGQAGYEDVRVLGILATGWDDPRVIAALDKQREEGIVTFPIVYDKDGAVRRLLGAKHTPELWLLDKDGRIAFYGAPENTLFPDAPGHRNLLREAVDALRRGERPAVTRYEPFGCEIE